MIKILLIALLILSGCNKQGDDMATIGEEVKGELVSTNVTETQVALFNNAILQNYPLDVRYANSTDIYQNTDKYIVVPMYDAADTYAVNDIVFKDSLVNRVASLVGDIPAQPSQYVAFDDTLDSDLWVNRYAKIRNLNGNQTVLENITRDIRILTLTPNINPYVIEQINLYDSGRVLVYTTDTAKLVYGFLSVPYDISSIGQLFVRDYSTFLTDIDWTVLSGDGMKLEIVGTVVSTGAKETYVHTMPAPFDFANLSFSTTFATPVSVQNIKHCRYVDNGSRIIGIEKTNNTIVSVPLTTSYNLSTAGTRVSKSFVVTDKTIRNNDIQISDDGLTAYIVVETVLPKRIGEIIPYAMSSAFDIATLDFATPLPTYNPKYEIDGFGAISFTIAMTDVGFVTVPYKTIFGSSEEINIMDMKLDTPFDFSTLNEPIFPMTLVLTDASIDREYRYLFTLSGAKNEKKQKVVVWDTLNDVEVTNTPTYLSELYLYYHLDSSSIEANTFVPYSREWYCKGLVVDTDGIYIRTDKDVSIETINSVDPVFAVVNDVKEIPSFSRIRSANPYRPFDGTNNTPAVFTSPMTYRVKSLESFNSFTLAKVLASSLDYTFSYPSTHSQYPVWLDGVQVASGGNGIVKTATVAIDCKRDANAILSLYPTTIMLYAGTQMEAGGEIAISLTHSSDVSLGDFTLNNAVSDSFTNLDFSHGLQDFNDYTPDAFGNIQRVLKQWSRSLT
jgi:hypothetical protein